MSSDDRIRALPTKPDELLAAIQNMIKIYGCYAENAQQIAKTRRALYTAYIKEGFTEGEALELVKGSQML